MINNFFLEREAFGTNIFYNYKNKKLKVCSVQSFDDGIEILYPISKDNYDKKESFLLELDYNKQVNSPQLITHRLELLNYNTLLFNNFSNLKPFDSGKTPSAIKRCFTDEQITYNEAYSKCINKITKKTYYVSIRHLEETIQYKDEQNKKFEGFFISISEYQKNKNSLVVFYGIRVSIEDLIFSQIKGF